jgi:hypothetical protein
MRRIATFLRQQRRAWRMLLAPEPKPFVWPKVSGGEHPSELCRCAGVPVTQGTAAYAVDHLPDCLWLAAMCRTCRGTGACLACQGEGIQPEGSTYGMIPRAGDGISSLTYEALRSRAGMVSAAVADLRGRGAGDESTRVVCDELLLREGEICELLERIRELETATRDLVEILVSNFEADELAADGRYVAARATLETP